MKRKILAQIIAGALICWAFIAISNYIFSACHHPRGVREVVNVDSLNQECYSACLDDMVVCVALTEGFYQEPYHCGARWTVGYGTTILPDGFPVTKETKRVNKDQAKEYVYSHLDQHVKPFLKYVERELSSEEMITTCLFVYNIGGENFSGYDEDGNLCGEPSQYLLALNNYEDAEECARKLTGFRSSNGKFAPGLLKRHWVEAAIFLGKITIDDILMLKPERFYDDTLAFYFVANECAEDGYYNYDFGQETVQDFLDANRNDSINVLSII